MLSRAKKYFIPNHSRSRPKRIFLGKRNKFAFYVGDKDYYRNFYLKTPHWESLRKDKLASNPTCEVCGKEDFLDVHHNNYKNLYDVKLTDLKTLCRACHISEHSKRNEQEDIKDNDSYIEKIIRRKKKFSIYCPKLNLLERQNQRD